MMLAFGWPRRKRAQNAVVNYPWNSCAARVKGASGLRRRASKAFPLTSITSLLFTPSTKGVFHEKC